MYSSKILSHRKAHGLSQTALGDLLGVSATAVYKWEHGQSQPDIPTLTKLSQLFQVSVDELVGVSAQPLVDAADDLSNIAVMTRAFQRMTPEEQSQYMAVGRTLYAKAFAQDQEDNR